MWCILQFNWSITKFVINWLFDVTRPAVTGWRMTGCHVIYAACILNKASLEIKPQLCVKWLINVLLYCMCHRFSTRSRLWRVDFDDLTNPLAGGMLTAVVEGSEKPQAGTPKMMDNLISTCDGSVYLQVSNLCVMLCKQCTS